MMELKRITNPNEIVTMFEIEDEHLDNQIPCSKAEWTQWLMNVCRVPSVGIWGFVNDEGKVKKYIVALNGVNPPISRAIYLLYQNFFRDHELGLQAIERIKEWALECGANRLAMQSKWPRLNRQFGWKEEGVAMYMEL